MDIPRKYAFLFRRIPPDALMTKRFLLPFSYSAANIFTLIISLNRGSIKQTETSDYMKGALL